MTMTTMANRKINTATINWSGPVTEAEKAWATESCSNQTAKAKYYKAIINWWGWLIGTERSSQEVASPLPAALAAHESNNEL